MKNKKIFFTSLLFIIIPVIWLSTFYSELPVEMPFIFNLNYEVIYTVNKIVLPIYIFVLIILHLVIYYIHNKETEVKNQSNLYVKLFLSKVPFAIAFDVFIAFYYYKYGLDANAIKVIMIILAIFIIFMSNYLPKVRQNKVIGIITKSTLIDDNSWDIANRKIAKVFFIVGLIMILTSFINPLISIIILSIAIFWMLYYICKLEKINKEKQYESTI